MCHHRYFPLCRLANTLLHRLIKVEPFPTLHLHVEERKAEDVWGVWTPTVLLPTTGWEPEGPAQRGKLQLSSFPLPFRVHLHRTNLNTT